MSKAVCCKPNSNSHYSCVTLKSATKGDMDSFIELHGYIHCCPQSESFKAWQEYHKSLSMLFFSILFSRTCNRWNLRTYLITFWINMFERVKQPTAFLSSVSNDWGPLGCLILISSHVIYQLFSSILFHWLNSPNNILPNENDILKENIMLFLFKSN